jgi:hypothetical protein
MKFTLEIDCDNAAFGEGDDDQRCCELGRILFDLGERLYSWHPLSGTVRDSNGNTVGRFKLIEE